MSNTKKILLIFSVLIIITFFVFIINISVNSDLKVYGNVQEFTGDTMLLKGVYSAESGKKELYDIYIKVDKETKIQKTSFEIPKGGDVFYVDKLPKEINMVDLTTLQKDTENVAVGIEIDLHKNLVPTSKKTAREIRYIAPKY